MMLHAFIADHTIWQRHDNDNDNDNDTTTTTTTTTINISYVLVNWREITCKYWTAITGKISLYHACRRLNIHTTVITYYRKQSQTKTQTDQYRYSSSILFIEQYSHSLCSGGTYFSLLLNLPVSILSLCALILNCVMAFRFSTLVSVKYVSYSIFLLKSSLCEPCVYYTM